MADAERAEYELEAGAGFRAGPDLQFGGGFIRELIAGDSWAVEPFVSMRVQLAPHHPVTGLPVWDVAMPVTILFDSLTGLSASEGMLQAVQVAIANGDVWPLGEKRAPIQVYVDQVGGSSIAPGDRDGQWVVQCNSCARFCTYVANRDAANSFAASHAASAHAGDRVEVKAVKPASTGDSVGG